jgi:hypothetical protein
MRMLSQVTKNSAIPKHAIYLETNLDFVAKSDLCFFFFSAEDLEDRLEAFRS